VCIPFKTFIHPSKIHPSKRSQTSEDVTTKRNLAGTPDFCKTREEFRPKITYSSSLLRSAHTLDRRSVPGSWALGKCSAIISWVKKCDRSIHKVIIILYFQPCFHVSKGLLGSTQLGTAGVVSSEYLLSSLAGFASYPSPLRCAPLATRQLLSTHSSHHLAGLPTTNTTKKHYKHKFNIKIISFALFIQFPATLLLIVRPTNTPISPKTWFLSLTTN